MTNELTPAQTFKKTFGVWPTQAFTLKVACEEHVCMSYLADLKACVDAGLVVFGNNGTGNPALTDLGRAALKAVQS